MSAPRKFSMTCCLLVFLQLFQILGCRDRDARGDSIAQHSDADSLALAKMIRLRETAMVEKDIQTVMSQFSEDATWINSQGYYFQGKAQVARFHEMLSNRDSVDYRYEAGVPRIRIVDSKNALAYYSWKMFWYNKEEPRDTTFREIGLMTLTAHKLDGKWKWVAVTNQHTPWFYDTITPEAFE